MRAKNGIQRFIMAPGLTAALILCGAAAVNAVKPENMIATDGKVEVVDGKHIQVITREFPFEPGQRFSVSNSNGRINVTGWDEEKVLITAEKRLEKRVGAVGWVLNKLNVDFKTDEDMSAYFEKVGVEIETTEGGVTVETIKPKHNHNANVTVSYDIKVPRSTDLTAHTSNGRLIIASINGETELRSSNGRVTAEDIVGAVAASTSNGSIELDNITGSIRAKTSNGSVRVDHPEPLGANESIDCSTSNGSVRVELAQSSQFNLKAKTTNGRIRTDFDVTPDEERQSKRRISGAVGAGGGLVELSTTNGSITLDSDD